MASDIRLRLLALLAAGVIAGNTPSAEDCRSWRKVREGAAGTLYQRCLDDSPIDQVMISARFRAPPGRLFALVTDYEAFEEFIPNVIDSRVLKVSGNRQWVYHRLRFPGPVADRAYVMRSTATADAAHPGAFRVEWELADRDFPQSGLPDGLRPERFSGFWDIGVAADGSTLARYAVHSNPGGWLPAWLVETMTVRYVQQVIAAVRKRLGE
jgi:hypothetical protein